MKHQIKNNGTTNIKEKWLYNIVTALRIATAIIAIIILLEVAPKIAPRTYGIKEIKNLVVNNEYDRKY